MSLALVYDGPATLPGCPEAVAALLTAHGFDVATVGPDGDRPLEAEVLAGAALYAQPGGGSLRHAWRHLRRHRRVLRSWVADGGSYVGFCLGAYLAGRGPGLGLLPGDTDQYVTSPHATVDDPDADALVEVDWRGRRRTLFFQDGARFTRTDGTDVLARYPGGEVAALVAAYGRGRVGVVGPHPEATADWFTDVGLPVHDARDLADDLVTAATT
ncbi:BPL-N domain-containing protein [Actinomycetospora sp. NBRC 106378]|uniref:BPL-N domain-containing protein n=1 Tax=Actinomycetospora sp. NBRC 106378 TaxID=3032208 RepID=UPI0024A1C6F7|nr:BPL-N domain-containing protein [Actinomycetospora sp. NBRC 106378]GLZ52108.1 hypothetical protein Acsp07_17250 [Actinomycetospora sp. NBRC 106378]